MININNTVLVNEHNFEEILDRAVQLCPYTEPRQENIPYLSADSLDLQSPINLGGHNNFNKTPIHDLNFEQE